MCEKKEADSPGPSFLRCSKLEPLPYIVLSVVISIFWIERNSMPLELFERPLVGASNKVLIPVIVKTSKAPGCSRYARAQGEAPGSRKPPVLGGNEQ